MTRPKKRSKRYYVYKLIDPRSGWPFYIGKGTGNRTWQHLSVSSETVTELLEGEAEIAVEESLATDAGNSAALLEGKAKERSTVQERVKAIRDAGAEPVVQWLIKKDGEDMDEKMAFAVEAALIDTLKNLPLPDSDRIVNKVSGHGYVFGAHESLSVVNQARKVELPVDRDFVVVSSKGVWGGRDSTGQFAGASRQVAWDNAHEVWPMNKRAFDHVNTAAGSANPVVLLGLASDPLGRHSNIIVCVEELSGVTVVADDDATRADYAGGKRFIRPDRELPEATALRERLVGHAPLLHGKPARPNSLLVYMGPWHDDVVG